MGVTPITWWVWLTPAHKSWLWNVLKFCRLIAKSLAAWNQSKWEYLHHWNGQTLQKDLFLSFLLFLVFHLFLFLSFSILFFLFYSFPSFFFFSFIKETTYEHPGRCQGQWSEVARRASLEPSGGVYLPTQETQVWSLFQKGPTCHRAAKSMHHNCRSCALQPGGHNHWARVWQLLRPRGVEPALCNQRSRPSEKLEHCTWKGVPTRQN